ncbi:MAG TPA: HypC/HybG/HupF family hydrogenase formation chaperone [Terriglobales bacterium]|nr:HypC/HybG/HupF family hydrogenase formation chaperone [Terriglobales bacterium]
MCLAVPGRILSIAGAAELRTGRVSFGGIVKEVNLAYVPEAREGEYVLVHAGFAISVVDEAEAAQTLQYLREMGGSEIAELQPEAETAEATKREHS